ncbi:recombinase family protein [Lichenicola cladoniae]
MVSVCGYARISASNQDLTILRDALMPAGCSIIREDKTSGTSATEWTKLRTLLNFIRKGDSLSITCANRLAALSGTSRSSSRALKARGANLRCTE